jgi:hypothetical protein
VDGNTEQKGAQWITLLDALLRVNCVLAILKNRTLMIGQMTEFVNIWYGVSDCCENCVPPDAIECVGEVQFN